MPDLGLAGAGLESRAPPCSPGQARNGHVCCTQLLGEKACLLLTETASPGEAGVVGDVSTKHEKGPQAAGQTMEGRGQGLHTQRLGPPSPRLLTLWCPHLKDALSPSPFSSAADGVAAGRA